MTTSAIDKSRFNHLIKGFQFAELFNELGWDYVKKTEKVVVHDTEYLLNAMAEKKGFVVFVCTHSSIPDDNIRKKIDNAVTKLYFEHLIIFCDSAKNHQIWQLIIREHGKPVVPRKVHYYSHQEPELLFQKLKGLFFSIDDEDRISIVDVKSAVTSQFNTNAEKVTKKFYKDFKEEHTAFLEFINGVTDKVDKEWYASLMLNRLMFIYFIQRKGFLDNDKDYLRNRLKTTQEKKGKNKFYSFYRNFLLILFHKGLGSHERTPELESEIGIVPYLNGGLFDVHHIEENYPDIKIEDKAFEKIFDFFDQYEWHLDTRITATGREINPDVIGYIFEKYINDRAAMGAYYTKEDITDYISKNCVIPFLFDEVKRNYPKALKPDSEIWKLLQTNPDAYIYDAVKHGVNLTFPDEIAIGLDTAKPNLLERRKEWNKSAPQKYALPTEIWREVVERRRRYNEIKSKLENCKITEINDFITYNLNIRQFAQDVIENTDDPDLIRHFYKAIRNITVLDPTCGSGAFLFAALNILEPLYESCIQRMEDYVNESAKGKYKFFEDTLLDVKSDKHPNIQYFIYKSIILNNLYGVDIMKEAVETAKLRLFLKLAATVDADYNKPNLGLEPLPDIDFNIRSGNTLVGFASLNDVEKAVEGSLDSVFMKKEIEDIKEQAEKVGMAYERFTDSQLIIDSPSSRGAKTDLENRLQKLNDRLNIYQAQLYGVEVKNPPSPPFAKGGKSTSPPFSIKSPSSPPLEKGDIGGFEKWKSSHQPFHWFAEFYEIVHEKGGFDVIIGNPPYVEYNKVKKDYTIKGYQTESCGNLYATMIERSMNLLDRHGSFGFIVPISLVCTQRMSPAQTTLSGHSRAVWVSNYAERPGKLFVGAEVLLTIVIANAGNTGTHKLYSTSFTKWSSDERDSLFDRTMYSFVDAKPKPYVIPKLGCTPETTILRKIIKLNGKLARYFLKSSKHPIYYRIGGGRYWKIFTNFQPQFILNGKQDVSSRENYLYLEDATLRDAIIAILSSSFFYWYFILTTNCRDLNPSDLNEFPIDSLSKDNTLELSKLCKQLMEDYKTKCQMKEKTSSLTGHIVYQEFYPRLSKPIIDEIDRVLAKHYGFTDEELDFIVNYDIKYRMGRETEEN